MSTAVAEAVRGLRAASEALWTALRADAHEPSSDAVLQEALERRQRAVEAVTALAPLPAPALGEVHAIVDGDREALRWGATKLAQLGQQLQETMHTREAARGPAAPASARFVSERA